MVRERRAYVRVRKDIPLKVKIPVQNSDVVIQTLDLSCNGALCSTNRFIAPMTKVDITMLLPSHSSKTAEKVSCKGVVVRVKEDVDAHDFKIGLYFNDIKEKQRLKLEEYVAHMHEDMVT